MNTTNETGSTSPLAGAPNVFSPLAEWGILGAIVLYTLYNWIGPLMKSSAGAATAETKRVDSLIAFQQAQLTSLTQAIQQQTTVVTEQTVVVTRLVSAVDSLCTAVRENQDDT